MEESLSPLALFPVSAKIPKFSHILTLKWRWALPQKVTYLALILENKSDITVREFIFHYAINSCAYLELLKYSRAITKFFLSTVLTTGFGASILSKKFLILLSTKSRR